MSTMPSRTARAAACVRGSDGGVVSPLQPAGVGFPFIVVHLAADLGEGLFVLGIEHVAGQKQLGHVAVIGAVVRLATQHADGI